MCVNSDSKPKHRRSRTATFAICEPAAPATSAIANRDCRRPAGQRSRRCPSHHQDVRFARLGQEERQVMRGHRMKLIAQFDSARIRSAHSRCRQHRQPHRGCHVRKQDHTAIDPINFLRHPPCAPPWSHRTTIVVDLYLVHPRKQPGDLDRKSVV